MQYTREHGGYFRRFTGGLLERWVRQDLLKSVRAGGPGGAGRQRKSAASSDQVKSDEPTAAAPRTLSDLAASLSNSGNSEQKEPSLVHTSEEAGQTENVGPIETPLRGSAEPAVPTTEGLEQQHEKRGQSKGETVGTIEDDQGSGPVTPTGIETPPSSTHDEPHSSQGSGSKTETPALDLLTKDIDPPPEVAGQHMTLAERATLAWLVADRIIQSDKQNLDVGGSTASVALFHSLDTPAVPWYSSKLVSVTTAQVGDTRMLLCATEDGRAIPMTNVSAFILLSRAKAKQRLLPSITTLTSELRLSACAS